MAGYIEADAVVKELRLLPLFGDGCVSDADLRALARQVTLVTGKRLARIFDPLERPQASCGVPREQGPCPPQ